MSTTPARIVVLISGSGSNLQALIDACAQGELAAQIVAVIANKPLAYGLERARKFKIPTVVQTLSSEQTRAAYDETLAACVKTYQPDWIVLAGWMHVLSNNFLTHFSDKIINLHPALPGAFPGTQAIAKAFAAFQRGEITETGVMVHWVPDEAVDAGPALAIEKVPIIATDDLATLTARVHAVEHRLLVATLQQLIHGFSKND